MNPELSRSCKFHKKGASSSMPLVSYREGDAIRNKSEDLPKAFHLFNHSRGKSLNHIFMQFMYRRIFLKSLSCVLFTGFSSTATLFAEMPDTLRTYQLQDVIVSEKGRRPVTQTATPMQVLTKKQLSQLPLPQMSEALRRFAGVSVKDYGGIGGLKTVSIRSLGAQHTGVVYDGIILSDCQSGQIDISRFSLENVAELSLTVGQSDNIYQSARAFSSAGVLTIVTDQLSPTQRPKQQFRLNAATGSYGLANSSVFYNYRFSNKLAASAHAEYLRADGRYPFSISTGKNLLTGKRENSDIESWRAEINLAGQITSRQQWSLKGYLYDSERGLPGAVIIDNSYSAERLSDRNYFIQAAYENRISQKIKLKGAVKWNYAWNRDYNNLSHGITDYRYKQTETYASVTGHYAPIQNLSFSFSEDFSYNDLSANTYQHQFPERYSSHTLLAAQYKNARITATTSVLYTYITERVKSGSVPADRSRWSPAAAISVRPFAESNLRIRASYKDIFRVPTFNDMYYLIIGNTDLKPENARQANMGITWSGAVAGIDYLMVSVDGYYNRVTDKIVAIPTMFIWRMSNADETEGWGTDILLSAEKSFQNGFGVAAGTTYNWMRAIDISDPAASNWRHQLPYTPKHSGNGNITLTTPWVNVGYSVNYASLRYKLALNEYANRIDRYADHSVSVSRSFGWGIHTLRIQGSVNNIGNKNYEIIKYYPMAPRNYRVSLHYAF